MTKDKEIRVKVDKHLQDRINQARGLINQNAFLGQLVEKALDLYTQGKIEIK